MVKAKDLLEQTKSAKDTTSSMSQEDKVNDAYENISKRLDALRKGEPVDDVEADGNDEEVVDIEPKSPAKTQADDSEDEKDAKRFDQHQDEEEVEVDQGDESRGDRDDNPQDGGKPAGKDPRQMAEEEEEDNVGRNLHKDDASQEQADSLTAGRQEEFERGDDRSAGKDLDDSRESRDGERVTQDGHDEVEEQPVRRVISGDDGETLDDLAGGRVNPYPPQRSDEPENSPEEDNHGSIPNLHTSNRSVNQTFMRTNPYHHQPRGSSSKFQYLILGIVAVAVLAGTVLLLKGQFKANTPSPSPTPAAPVPTPTPTPIPTPPPVERPKYKVKVLNGTGKSGLAASISAKLKELGYQTEKSANATNSSFTRTIVRVKENMPGLLEQLVADLIPEFDATSGGFLKDSVPYDAEVILGGK